MTMMLWASILSMCTLTLSRGIGFKKSVFEPFFWLLFFFSFFLFLPFPFIFFSSKTMVDPFNKNQISPSISLRLQTATTSPRLFSLPNPNLPSPPKTTRPPLSRPLQLPFPLLILRPINFTTTYTPPWITSASSKRTLSALLRSCAASLPAPSPSFVPNPNLSVAPSPVTPPTLPTISAS